MRRVLLLMALILALGACTPPPGGSGNYNNSDPYNSPEYRRGVSPW